MAHLQHSKRDNGFYLNTRRELDLGWRFLDDNGNIVGRTERHDLDSYEQVLLHNRKVKTPLPKPRRPRKRLPKPTRRVRKKK